MWLNFYAYLIDLLKSGCLKVRVYYNIRDDEILFMGDKNLSTYSQMVYKERKLFLAQYNKNNLGYFEEDIADVLEWITNLTK